MKDRAIFNLQRYSILNTKLNSQTQDIIPNDYAYAWYSGVYPFFTSSNIHEDLEEFFTFNKKQTETIAEYVDKEWLAQKTYTFYELEDHFDVRGIPVEGISRECLFHVLRYIYLHRGFDKIFWDKLLTPMEYPTEVESLTREFSIDELYII